MSKKQKIGTRKAQSLIQLGLVILIAIFLNILGNAFFTKIDLTEEKRYTFTPATRDLVKSVDDVITVKVLFEGEFPAGMKRLQRAVRESLDNFRSYTGYLEYEFVDPYKGDIDEVNAMVEEMRKDGIVPVNLRFVDVDGTTEVFGYPYAVFYYKGRMLPVNFLETVNGVHPEKNLENSISLLEYKFANAIQKLESSERKNILFTVGHGELKGNQTVDIRQTLGAYYNVDTINLDSVVFLPTEDVHALVIAKPRETFPEKHKFVIDQYVMNGGKVLWLIDPLNATLDSLSFQNKYIPLDYPLNIDDLLFKYGARINPNLVLDLQCSRIPQVIDAQGNISMFNWYYHPVITSRSDHPIVKSLDNVNLSFPSSIDTVRTKTPIKKTILLESSEYSRLQFSPVRLDFEVLRYDPDPDKFNKPHQPVAVLLEGAFSSLYENRVTEGMSQTLDQLGQSYVSQGVPTKMLVVSDGDIAKNLVARDGTYRPVGYNQYERTVFLGNKNFLINAIEYLVDDNGIIAARGKVVKSRLLNVVKARAEKAKWQVLNVLVPLLFLGAFGFFYLWWRKKRFAS